MELELTRMEQSDDDLTDPSDSEDSNMGMSETHWPNDPSEVKSRLHAYIAHEQEILAELLSELESEVQTNSENISVERIKRCFRCIDDIICFVFWLCQSLLRLLDILLTYPIFSSKVLDLSW